MENHVYRGVICEKGEKRRGREGQPSPKDPKVCCNQQIKDFHNYSSSTPKGLFCLNALITDPQPKVD
jgi:hypothetical protein